MSAVHLFPFAVVQILIATVFLATFFVLGAPLLRRWAAFASPVERLAIALGAGLAAFLLICQALALAGVFFLPVLGSIAAAAAWQSRRDLREVVRTLWRERLAVLAVAAMLLPVFLLTLYPTTDWDGLMYHLPLAELHATSHRLGYDPEIRFAHFPQGTELLLASALLLGVSLPQIAIFVAVAVAVAALASLTARYASRGAAWIAIALWLSSPLVLRLGSICYVESGLACMVELFAFAALRWRAAEGDNWLYMAAFFASTAAAIKMNGLFLVALLLPLALRSRPTLRRLAAVAAIVFATCGLYYARAAWLTGSPLYPFLTGLLGSARGPWDASDIVSLQSTVRRYGVPVTAANLLALPWDLSFAAGKFDSDVAIGPWFMLAVPCVLAAAIRRPKLRWVCGVVAAYVAIWIVTIQEYRGLAPILPLVAFLIAGVLADVVERLTRGAGERAKEVAAAAVAILVFLPGVRFARSEVRSLGWPSPSAEARQSYVEARVPGADCIRFVQATAKDGHRIFALYGENLRYFGHGRVCGDWFGPCRFEEVLSRIGSTAELQRHLREHGFTHLVIDKARFAELRHAPLSGGLPSDFADGFDAVYESTGCAVFALRTGGREG